MSYPKNHEAEQATIGSMLVKGSSITVAQKYLTPEMFYHDDLRAMFESLLAIVEAGVACDIITLGEELRRNGKFKLLNEGMETVAACQEAVVTAEHTEYYSKIVAACWYEREVIVAAGRLAKAVEDSVDPQPILNKIRDLVMAKEGLTAAMTFDYSHDLVAFYSSLGDKDSAMTNTTGIPAIDEAWNGSRGGEVNVWGAAPNVGKSLMLLNLMNLAANHDRRCLYVGTEMSAYETVQRHLAIVSGYSAGRIRAKNIPPDGFLTLKDAIAEKMVNYKIHILDKPEPNLAQIESAIVSSKAEIVYLDYLERFSLPREESMRLRVKEFMRQVKSLARRHNVEVHLASQLNRTTYGTEDKRPTLADLSESSAVEKEADRVMLLWRPKAKQTNGTHTILECIQAKNRHGHRGMAIDLKLNNINLRIEGTEEEYVQS